MYDKIVLRDGDTVYSRNEEYVFSGKKGKLYLISSHDGIMFRLHFDSGVFVDIPFASALIAVGHLVQDDAA